MRGRITSYSRNCVCVYVCRGVCMKPAAGDINRREEALKKYDLDRKRLEEFSKAVGVSRTLQCSHATENVETDAYNISCRYYLAFHQF